MKPLSIIETALRAADQLPNNPETMRFCLAIGETAFALRRLRERAQQAADPSVMPVVRQMAAELLVRDVLRLTESAPEGAKGVEKSEVKR